MVSKFRKVSDKAGLPPGTLVYVGDQKIPVTRISLFEYDQNTFEEKEIASIEECIEFKEKESVTWINMDGLGNTELIEKLDRIFGVHPLVLEDILNTHQRPKIDDHGEYIYVVLRMFSIGSAEDIESEQISFILGENYILSFQEEAGDFFDDTRERIRSNKGRIRKMGADYLLNCLLDTIIDNYFVVLEKIEEDIAILEESSASTQEQLSQKIHQLKRNLIFFRKQVWPVRELLSTLTRSESKLIKRSTIVFLRDVYDHTVSVVDSIDSFRDVLNGLHDINLSNISYRLNEVMKVLTMISTIFIPVTFIAGIYGMNFQHMPELQWRFGYFAVLIGMAVVMTALFIFFKHKKWL